MKFRPQTIYTPPPKGGRTQALYVVGRSCLPESAKRVFQLLVWHTNGKTGQCDPSQELLLKGTGLKDPKSITRGMTALKKAGFITVLRRARPHHSAAYQINWELMAEMQRRWEAEYRVAMETRRRDRAAEVYAFKMRTLRASDVLLVGKGKPRRHCSKPESSPPLQGGIPPLARGGTERPNPPLYGGVNPFKPFEQNSLNNASEQDLIPVEASEPEPRPETGSVSAAIGIPSGGQKEGNQEKRGTEAQAYPHAQRRLNLLAAIKGGWEARGRLDSDVDPRIASLARLAGRVDPGGWNQFSTEDPWCPTGSLPGDPPKDTRRAAA